MRGWKIVLSTIAFDSKAWHSRSVSIYVGGIIPFPLKGKKEQSQDYIKWDVLRHLIRHFTHLDHEDIKTEITNAG